VLVEFDRAADIIVTVRSSAGDDQSFSIAATAHTPTVIELEQLVVGRSYRVQCAVENGESRVATIRPIGPGAMRLATVSCYNFTQKLQSSAWDELAERATSGTLDVVLHTGDQIYGDEVFRFWSAYLKKVPSRLRESFLPSICEAYRGLYRAAWNHRPVQEVLRNASNLMLWDDHEVTDDFGDKQSFTDPNSTEHMVARCGWQVYREYQRILWDENALDMPMPLGQHEGYLQTWGHTAALFVDVRGGRAFEPFDRETATPNVSEPYLGHEQWQEIMDVLSPSSSRLRDVENLLVICPVPLVFFPASLGRDVVVRAIADDLSGHWSHAPYRAEQHRLLSALRNWQAFEPGREVMLLGGDVHFGCEMSVFHERDGATRVFRQLVSSPVHRRSENAHLVETLIVPHLTSPNAERTTKPRDFHWKASKVTVRRNFGELTTARGEAITAGLVET
tara:strand:+ start:58090 stop:59436 length:1347 start_codon:yes stop_codon:yes gene_type:complete